jgi:hypothetical protein
VNIAKLPELVRRRIAMLAGLSDQFIGLNEQAPADQFGIFWRTVPLLIYKAKPLIATLIFCVASATAAAMDRGQFKNVPPEIREWFENMRSPKGIMCCSYADGHRTRYDIRQGQYWVPIEGEWYPVPPEAVIKAENPVGEAIVWYLLQA